jgi:hypothetical protein
MCIFVHILIFMNDYIHIFVMFIFLIPYIIIFIYNFKILDRVRCMSVQGCPISTNTAVYESQNNTVYNPFSKNFQKINSSFTYPLYQKMKPVSTDFSTYSGRILFMYPDVITVNTTENVLFFSGILRYKVLRYRFICM